MSGCFSRSSFASFGIYTIVEEKQCLIYVLFGKVRLILTEPGLHFPFATALSWRALFVNFFGDVRTVDLRLDQEYLRSQPSIPKKARPWASVSGTRCGSAIQSRISSRTPTRAARSAPT